MEIKARIPGTIVAINVKPGDTVKARDNLGTMEAMKMEQPIPCPKDGVVKDVLVSVGDKVKSGAVLLSIELPSGAAPEEENPLSNLSERMPGAPLGGFRRW